jgi:4-diphosphocytidyl-2-C-methyl-D-erythritol kinase
MQYPQIAAVKEMLYAKGALFAAMTGTGSTVYGIFAKDVPPKIQWDNYPLLRIVG